MTRHRHKPGWQRFDVSDLPAMGLEPGLRGWRKQAGDGLLTVLVGNARREGWHMSISHPDRYPGWDEISEARYRFVPDEVSMVMHLPPRSEYVNLHETCFHLWEGK